MKNYEFFYLWMVYHLIIMIVIELEMLTHLDYLLIIHYFCLDLLTFKQ